MASDESSGFKMRMDDGSRSSDYQEKIGDLQYSRLSQRVTLVTILVPSLLGIFMLVAYLDMKRKVDKTFTSEAREVQSLSESLESRFSSLSLQFARLEDTFAKQVLSIEKEMGSLKKSVSKNEKLGDRINASKASRGDLSKEVAKVNTEFESIRGDLGRLSAQLGSLEETVIGQLADLSEAVNSQILINEEVREDISAMSSDTVDRAAMDLALRTQKENYEQKLSLLTRHFERQIASIQERIGALVTLQPGPENAGESPPQSKEPSPSPAEGETERNPSPSEPANGDDLPATGAIVEQEIR